MRQKVGIHLDIETSVNIGTFYGPLYETRILNVLEHAHLTSFSVKFVGEKKIYTYDLQDFPLYKKEPKSDKALLKELTRWIEKADYIVAHNGDKFDIPMVNTRLQYWKLPVLPPKKTIDTLKTARRLWKLPSYSLDFLGQYFGFGRKVERGGRKQEKIYNSNDVYLLEKLFELERPHLWDHPALREVKIKVINKEEICPRCGGTHVQSRGQKVANGVVYRYFQCQNKTCFKWFPVTF